MDPLSRLEDMLSEFRPLFKYNNFDHFRTFVEGLINTPHRGTMTQVYLSTDPSTTYWCLPKFLSRGVWCVDKVTVSLMRQVRNVYSEGVYVYDESHAVNNGGKQYQYLRPKMASFMSANSISVKNTEASLSHLMG